MFLRKSSITPTYSSRNFPLKVASFLLDDNNLFDKKNFRLNVKTLNMVPSITKILELFETVENLKMDNINYNFKEENNELMKWGSGRVCSIHFPNEEVTLDDTKFLNELEQLFDLSEFGDEGAVLIAKKLFNVLVVRDDEHDNFYVKRIFG